MIDHAIYGRYDDPQMSSQGGVRVNRPRRDTSVAALRARLDAGEWLAPGEVGPLFGKKRHTVINWMKAGKMGFRTTPSGYRECNPADVLRELAKFEQISGGSESTAPDSPE